MIEEDNGTPRGANGFGHNMSMTLSIKIDKVAMMNVNCGTPWLLEDSLLFNNCVLYCIVYYWQTS